MSVITPGQGSGGGPSVDVTKIEDLLIDVKTALAVNENEMKNVKTSIDGLKLQVDNMEHKIDELQTFKQQYDLNIRWMQKVVVGLGILFCGGLVTGFTGKTEVLKDILTLFAG
jgi:hypothetical protein